MIFIAIAAAVPADVPAPLQHQIQAAIQFELQRDRLDGQGNALALNWHSARKDKSNQPKVKNIKCSEKPSTLTCFFLLSRSEVTFHLDQRLPSTLLCRANFSKVDDGRWVVEYVSPRGGPPMQSTMRCEAPA